MGSPVPAGVQRLFLRLHRGVGAVRAQRIRLEAGSGWPLAGLVHKLVSDIPIGHPYYGIRSTTGTVHAYGTRRCRLSCHPNAICIMNYR